MQGQIYFHWGGVLYEILSGQLAFPGQYEAAVVYSLLNAEPDALENFRTDLPEQLAPLIIKCLQKQKESRNLPKLLF